VSGGNRRAIVASSCLAVMSESGPAEEAELLQRAARFERYAGSYGVPAAALDQVFTWLGCAYRLSGCAVRRCKFPFTAERVSDGKLVQVPCNVVRAAFLAISGGRGPEPTPMKPASAPYGS
jgi:hypothetical protein